MTLREKIEVMQAFEQGEEIEISYVKQDMWTDISNPGWSWGTYDYRVKPKPKQTITIEKWLCMSAWDNYFVMEGEKAFFKTGGYDRQQVKLLSTRRVGI